MVANSAAVVGLDRDYRPAGFDVCGHRLGAGATGGPAERKDRGLRPSIPVRGSADPVAQSAPAFSRLRLFVIPTRDGRLAMRTNRRRVDLPRLQDALAVAVVTVIPVRKALKERKNHRPVPAVAPTFAVLTAGGVRTTTLRQFPPRPACPKNKEDPVHHLAARTGMSIHGSPDTSGQIPKCVCICTEALREHLPVRQERSGRSPEVICDSNASWKASSRPSSTAFRSPAINSW